MPPVVLRRRGRAIAGGLAGLGTGNGLPWHRYSDSYASDQFRALQQSFNWHATEGPGEPRPSPVAGLRLPKAGDKLVPVFTGEELAAMLAACKGGGFQAWRDSVGTRLRPTLTALAR